MRTPQILIMLCVLVFLFQPFSTVFADDIKVFDSGSKKFRLSILCSSPEDQQKINFEKLHIEDPKADASKLTISGKAPVEGILVTRDEHLRIGDDQNFQLNFMWDGGDQEIPLYLVEKDGSVYNFVVVVKAIAAPVEVPTAAADPPAKKPVKKSNDKESSQAAKEPPAKPDQSTQDLENTLEKNPVPPPAPVASKKPKSTSERDRVFRSFPFEVEARLSGEGYNSNITLMGGASFSGWLARGKQFILQTPRFGFDIDYDRNITSLKDQYGNSVQFYRLVADVKYNLSPKGTNRDNLYGPVINYENFSFGSQATNAMGVGAYWSHPIYSGVDSGLNYLKWFRHPKWLDIQGQYYLKAIDTTSLVGPTFNLAARMKIYFRPKIFYDFGLSYSTADFKNSQSAEVITSIFTATLGLGANF